MKLKDRKTKYLNRLNFNKYHISTILITLSTTHGVQAPQQRVKKLKERVKIKTLNDGVAIHDRGFQFFLLLNVKHEINELIGELIGIEKAIKYHKEVKSNKEYTWYNSKTKLTCFADIKGYSRSSVFTFKEINNIYKERKTKYDFLLKMVEESLEDVKRSCENNKEWRAPYGSEDRNDILIDHTEIDSF